MTSWWAPDNAPSADQFRVAIAGTDVVVGVRQDEPLLTALARSGYAHRTGCRRGGCGVCKLEIVQGTVTYPIRVADSVLTPEEREQGVCLSCRAVPETDLTVQMRADDNLRCVAPLLAALNAKAIRK